MLNEEAMQTAYNTLSGATLNITKLDDTLVEGTVNCTQAGLLYTSIPQVSGNWHAFVDGKEVEITLIGDAMISLMLNEGSHTVTFRYENKAFTTGLTVSLISLVLFALLLSYDLYRKKFLHK